MATKQKVRVSLTETVRSTATPNSAKDPTSAERVAALSERNAKEAKAADKANRIDRGLPPR